MFVAKNEDNEIIASSLLLQKRLPVGYSYFYSPRGFVLDYTDEKTFSLFTKEIVKFVKAKKGIFLKIDPDIIRKKQNYH